MSLSSLWLRDCVSVSKFLPFATFSEDLLAWLCGCICVITINPLKTGRGVRSHLCMPSVARYVKETAVGIKLDDARKLQEQKMERNLYLRWGRRRSRLRRRVRGHFKCEQSSRLEIVQASHFVLLLCWSPSAGGNLRVENGRNCSRWRLK